MPGLAFQCLIARCQLVTTQRPAAVTLESMLQGMCTSTTTKKTTHTHTHQNIQNTHNHTRRRSTQWMAPNAPRTAMPTVGRLCPTINVLLYVLLHVLRYVLLYVLRYFILHVLRCMRIPGNASLHQRSIPAQTLLAASSSLKCIQTHTTCCIHTKPQCMALAAASASCCLTRCCQRALRRRWLRCWHTVGYNARGSTVHVQLNTGLSTSTPAHNTHAHTKKQSWVTTSCAHDILPRPLNLPPSTLSNSTPPHTHTHNPYQSWVTTSCAMCP